MEVWLRGSSREIMFNDFPHFLEILDSPDFAGDRVLTILEEEHLVSNKVRPRGGVGEDSGFSGGQGGTTGGGKRHKADTTRLVISVGSADI